MKLCICLCIFECRDVCYVLAFFFISSSKAKNGIIWMRLLGSIELFDFFYFHVYLFFFFWNRVSFSFYPDFNCTFIVIIWNIFLPLLKLRFHIFFSLISFCCIFLCFSCRFHRKCGFQLYLDYVWVVYWVLLLIQWKTIR